MFNFSFSVYAQQDSLSSSVTPSSSDTITYSNSTYGISINYPLNWDKEELDYDPQDRIIDIVTFYSRFENPSDPFADYYGVSVDKDLFYEADLNEYLQETIDAYETAYEDFELLASDATSSLAGKPAYSLTFSHVLEAESEDEEGINLRTFETGTLENNSAYYISFTAEENAYAELLPVVEQMIDTFKLLGGGATPETTTEPTPETTTEPTPETTTATQNTRDYNRTNTRDYNRTNTRDYNRTNTRDYNRTNTRDYNRTNTRDYNRTNTRDYNRTNTRAITV